MESGRCGVTGAVDFLDERERALKDTLHRAHYTAAAQIFDMRCGALVVSGPDVISHVKVARETVATSPEDPINIVEANEEVFCAIQSQVELRSHVSWNAYSEESNDFGAFFNGIYSINKNLNIIQGLLEDQPAQRLVDADLMGSCTSSGTSICAALLNQKDEFGDDTKCFMYTFSLRSHMKEIEVLDWINTNIYGPLGASFEFNKVRNGSGRVVAEKMETVILDPEMRRAAANGKVYGGCSLLDYCVNIVDQGRICQNGHIAHYYGKGSTPMLTGVIFYR